MMNILALGTYPSRRPVHGGQRRVSEIKKYYERNSIKYLHASVYSTNHYSSDEVTSLDYGFDESSIARSAIPFVDDILAGKFASTDEHCYEHFSKLISKFDISTIQLEQPFMYPLFKRLVDEDGFKGKLVYSSHNVEAPLKAQILQNSGVSRENINSVFKTIENMEKDIISSSDIVISVSSADSDIYRSWNTNPKFLVIANGNRINKIKEKPKGIEEFHGKYFSFVGSAYPPNVQGFVKLVVENGFYGFPAKKTFAICGGVSHGIFASHFYAPHADTYGDRVHFFNNPTDEEISYIIENSHCILLPITSGGGSNLKTAEAILSCKWVVATTTAMRSFERFIGQPGIIIADTPDEFYKAMQFVYDQPALELTELENSFRQQCGWDYVLDASGLADVQKGLI